MVQILMFKNGNLQELQMQVNAALIDINKVIDIKLNDADDEFYTCLITYETAVEPALKLEPLDVWLDELYDEVQYYLQPGTPADGVVDDDLATYLKYYLMGRGPAETAKETLHG